MFGPDPDAIYPNPAIPSICFIKNVITRPTIKVGDYTYYDNSESPEDSEKIFNNLEILCSGDLSKIKSITK